MDYVKYSNSIDSFSKFSPSRSLSLASFTGHVEGGEKWPENLQEFLIDYWRWYLIT